jgi:hypothetical protein
MGGKTHAICWDYFEKSLGFHRLAIACEFSDRHFRTGMRDSSARGLRRSILNPLVSA